MEDGKGELDVAIVTNASRSFFAASQAPCAFLVWTLFEESAREVHPKASLAYHTAVQRTSSSSRPVAILMDLVKVAGGDLDLGYADYVFWGERLKLDVLTTLMSVCIT